ncbi:MAG: hypothetical protein KDB27_08510 [Planctomycetales bacterium]|nr:hypothetical protein [Planctomycetales bacterium]
MLSVRSIWWVATFVFPSCVAFLANGSEPETAGQADRPRHWVWSTAHAIPAETTSEQSGYFSIIEGHNNRIYIGTAKYGDNAYLVEFDPISKQMKVVLDAEKEIGVDRTGFAAQAKFHTRNNVGKSGKIYLGTKQGYIKDKDKEKLTDYPGGYPMVFDPKTGVTKVYDIPVAHQGIISVTPDESRGLAYISTCSDGRPIESTHFMVLNLETGEYTDLLDCEHMYAFIVVDHLGRAYHPIRGGKIARYLPDAKRLEQLEHTIDGKPPKKETHLIDEHSHPINWDITADRKTLYSVPMSFNGLFSYDLTKEGSTLDGKFLGPLVSGAKDTDCRAMCVGPDGTVWAGVMATFEGLSQVPYLISYTPGDDGPVNHGPIAISNPDYTSFEGPQKHGVHRPFDEKLIPRYVIMGICAARDRTVYITTLYPFTVHAMKIPRVAGVTTEYRHNAHADVILTRLLKTDTLDGKGQTAPVKLRSLYVDQFPDNDLSRPFAAEHGVTMTPTIAEAITKTDSDGNEALAVDGIYLVAEHGSYPRSNTGQIMYPKRRLFGEIADTFRRTGQSVPVFSDKHLADNWTDAKWLYDTVKELNVPLMAGSSLPTLWRFPPVDVKRGAKLKELVALSYGPLDAYGFHALEMVQCLVERRFGGESGVTSVECLEGDAVWEAARQGRFDRELLRQALSRLKHPLPAGTELEKVCENPVLFLVNYRDGLRVSVLTPGHPIGEWAVAWKYADSDDADISGQIESTTFWTQETRPFMHFTYLSVGIEKMMHTGKPTWPVERTLLTSGILDAALLSKRDGHKVDTPWLDVTYTSDWNWTQPPTPQANGQ